MHCWISQCLEFSRIFTHMEHKHLRFSASNPSLVADVVVSGKGKDCSCSGPFSERKIGGLILLRLHFFFSYCSSLGGSLGSRKILPSLPTGEPCWWAFKIAEVSESQLGGGGFNDISCLYLIWNLELSSGVPSSGTFMPSCWIPQPFPHFPLKW